MPLLTPIISLLSMHVCPIAYELRNVQHDLYVDRETLLIIEYQNYKK